MQDSVSAPALPPTGTSPASNIFNDLVNIYRHTQDLCQKAQHTVQWMKHQVENLTNALPRPLGVLCSSLYSAAPYIALRFICPFYIYIAVIIGTIAFKYLTANEGERPDLKNLYNGVGFAATWIGGDAIIQGIAVKSIFSIVWGIINLFVANEVFHKSRLFGEIAGNTNRV